MCEKFGIDYKTRFLVLYFDAQMDIHEISKIISRPVRTMRHCRIVIVCCGTKALLLGKVPLRCNLQTHRHLSFHLKFVVVMKQIMSHSCSTQIPLFERDHMCCCCLLSTEHVFWKFIHLSARKISITRLILGSCNM